MNIIEKFRRLSFPVKLGVIGSFASIIGLLFAFMYTQTNNVSVSVQSREGGNAQTGIVQGSGTVVINDTKGVKQEISTDPRKELQNMGVPWERGKFFTAIKQKDYRVLELFFQGGMALNLPDSKAALVEFVMNDFDQKIADMFIKYNAIDPEINCPEPIDWQNGTWYTDRVMQDPRKTSFVRKICDISSIKEKFIKGISARQEEIHKIKEAVIKKRKDNEQKEKQGNDTKDMFGSIREGAFGTSLEKMEDLLSYKEKQLDEWIRARGFFEAAK